MRDTGGDRPQEGETLRHHETERDFDRIDSALAALDDDNLGAAEALAAQLDAVETDPALGPGETGGEDDPGGSAATGAG